MSANTENNEVVLVCEDQGPNAPVICKPKE
ncbi:hypothetical protein IPA_09790 [Ignicoccus pacificus DSM 13166]|uniref:Uncharacterized protein n=1 Tax=Ignicoccus pacificus DSM 13166 TaxID=940294 RepID=A0A977KC47_9CREN|nr:hypothetical protein IPA_09790 [Ignicoccus pacificus DSM 13166]